MRRFVKLFFLLLFLLFFDGKRVDERLGDLIPIDICQNGIERFEYDERALSWKNGFCFI